MDVNMPVMDGIQATKKIKSLLNEKKISKSYIIIVTTQSREDDKFTY